MIEFASGSLPHEYLVRHLLACSGLPLASLPEVFPSCCRDALNLLKGTPSPGAALPVATPTAPAAPPAYTPAPAAPPPAPGLRPNIPPLSIPGKPGAPVSLEGTECISDRMFVNAEGGFGNAIGHSF